MSQAQGAEGPRIGSLLYYGFWALSDDFVPGLVNAVSSPVLSHNCYRGLRLLCDWLKSVITVHVLLQLDFAFRYLRYKTQYESSG